MPAKRVVTSWLPRSSTPIRYWLVVRVSQAILACHSATRACCNDASAVS